MKSTVIIAAFCLLATGCSKSMPETRPSPAPERKSALVRMEVAAQKNVGIEVAPVRQSVLTEYLQVTGTVQPENSRVSQVRAPARGRIEEVLARTGDRVRSGQELARLDNLEAAELSAQLISARAELQRQKVLAASQARQAERNRRLAELGAAAKRDYEQSQAEREALDESVRAQQGVIAGLTARLRRFGISGDEPVTPAVTSIRAPFGGIVTKVVAAPGEVVEPAAELFAVADLSRVWVQAEVYEKDLGRIRVGQTAAIHVDTYPEAPFPGAVTYIADAVDPQTRTAKVRCEVANPALKLKLDMFATVRLPTTFSRRALALPISAIQQLDGKSVVWVQRGEAEFETREITTGKTVNGQVEVLAGLREGEPVVMEGTFHLKSIVSGPVAGEE